VEEVATSAQRPSNVAVYMMVENGDQPVTGLDESDFAIYEDDQLIDSSQSQQTLLPRDVAAIHRTLLLVDMSGALEADARQTIAEGASRFVTKVRQSQAVSVFAFDGGRQIRLIGEYPKGTDTVEQIPGLTSYTAADTSSNLNAAVIEALQKLDARLMGTARPIRVGTLVVFARGPDLAGRATEDQMLDALDDSEHHVLAIGIEGSGLSIGRLGDDGEFTATSLSGVGGAFEEAAARTAATFEKYYLLSYCSPARAGVRQLAIEVKTTDSEGNEVGGQLRAEFDATGFSSGCNPTASPRFVLPKPSEDEGDDDDDAPAPARTTAPGSKPAAQPAEPAETIVPPPDKPGYAQ
jgi:hypothetical protein